MKRLIYEYAAASIGLIFSIPFLIINYLKAIYYFTVTALGIILSIPMLIIIIAIEQAKSSKSKLETFLNS